MNYEERLALCSERQTEFLWWYLDFRTRHGRPPAGRTMINNHPDLNCGAVVAILRSRGLL